MQFSKSTRTTIRSPDCGTKRSRGKAGKHGMPLGCKEQRHGWYAPAGVYKHRIWTRLASIKKPSKRVPCRTHCQHHRLAHVKKCLTPPAESSRPVLVAQVHEPNGLLSEIHGKNEIGVKGLGNHAPVRLHAPPALTNQAGKRPNQPTNQPTSQLCSQPAN